MKNTETKKKNYELLYLADKQNEKEYSNFIKILKKLVKEPKFVEKDWKTAYEIKGIQVPQYVLVNFIASSDEIVILEKNIQQCLTNKIINRFLLINLDKEKKAKVKSKPLNQTNNNEK